MRPEPHSSLSHDLEAMTKPGEMWVACKSFPSRETLTKSIGKGVEDIEEFHRSQNALNLHTQSDLKI